VFVSCSVSYDRLQHSFIELRAGVEDQPQCSLFTPVEPVSLFGQAVHPEHQPAGDLRLPMSSRAVNLSPLWSDNQLSPPTFFFFSFIFSVDVQCFYVAEKLKQSPIVPLYRPRVDPDFRSLFFPHFAYIFAQLFLLFLYGKEFLGFDRL